MTTTQAASPGLCPVCGRVVSEWGPGPGGRPKAACPWCHSLERHRYLSLALHALAPDIASGPILDVAPMNAIAGILKRMVGDRYVGIDVDPKADHRTVQTVASLTQLPFASGAFDGIVCYHVLEHIPADRDAMQELARVLSTTGVALIQVPWRQGQPTDEDPFASPEERLRRFGQADHVRYYGKDFEDRMRSAGLETTLVTPGEMLDSDALEAMRLTSDEPVWIAARGETGVEGRSREVADRLRRRLPGAVVSRWLQSAVVSITDEHRHAPNDSEESLEMAAMLARQEAASARLEASLWEKRYKDLRSRWPVKVLSYLASIGRRVRTSPRNSKRT